MDIGKKAISMIGALALAGCVLPPKESAHLQPLSEAQLGLIGAPVEPTAENWWSSFGDPQLDRLIRLGLDHNPTLAQAQARVQEALAQVQSARAGLLPSVDVTANPQYERAPANYIIPPPIAGHTTWVGQAGVNLSWDLDFWGRQADTVRRAKDLALAARLDFQNAKLLLTVAISQAYLECYRQHALADIAERSEAQRQHILDITRSRLAAGLDTQVELRAAEGQLPQARVAREQAQAAATLAVHQLATLSAQGPADYPAFLPPVLTLDAALPVPMTLPINLLARRPDVLSARAGVQAADAGRLAAKAAFYPEVSLSALAGFDAFGMSNFVKWSARTYSAGPLLSLPLFDGGRLRAEYRGSEAQLDEAVATYNTTVLQAAQQAADQVTRLDALGRERLDQQQTLLATEAGYKLAEDRYRAGLANYLTVLNAETQVLSARQLMVSIMTDQALGRIALLQAVGGSFDPRALADAPSTAGDPIGRVTPSKEQR